MSQVGLLNIETGNPDIPNKFVTNSGTSIPTSNTLKILGGTNTATVSSGNTVTINTTVTGLGVTWVESTTDTVQLVNNYGYINKCVSSATVYTLPATSAVGDIICVVGYSSLGWGIAQNAGQKIYYGDSETTTGTSGGIVSTKKHDFITLLCVVANTKYQVITTTDNFEIG